MIIEVSTPVHLTESESKVEKALRNIFPSMTFIFSKGYFAGRSDSIESLDHFRELLQMQRIRDTAHTLMERSLFRNELKFCLNKQAAFVGKVNFSKDCPLGPITVSIQGEDLELLIDHLSPRTTEQ